MHVGPLVNQVIVFPNRNAMHMYIHLISFSKANALTITQMQT